MNFDRNAYLDWYVPRAHGGDGAINLHSSGMPALRPAELEIPDGDPWEMIRRFESALAAWLRIPADELLFTHGATSGTLLAILALVPPGREIAVERPIYEPLRLQAERLHPTVRFSRRMGERWRLPLAEVEALMSERTGLLMVTEPSNPSGTFLRRAELLTLADLAARRGAFLLVNEVYRGFSDAASFHGERDNIVIVSSMTKLLGTYGMRIGWISARPALIARLRSAHRNLGMPSGSAAAAGIGVLAKADAIRAEAMAIAASGRDVVEAWIGSTPGAVWTRPGGPGFACIHPADRTLDDVAFAETLHREHGVLVVPGSFFEAPGTIRLGWLQSGSRLAEGLDRISAAW